MTFIIVFLEGRPFWFFFPLFSSSARCLPPPTGPRPRSACRSSSPAVPRSGPHGCCLERRGEAVGSGGRGGFYQHPTTAGGFWKPVAY